MEKVEKLTSILEERSGLDVREAVACLKEYMEDFQERNPNFYVFNAVMHLDEATPHLHIDYIPLGHFFNGLEKRNDVV